MDCWISSCSTRPGAKRLGGFPLKSRANVISVYLMSRVVYQTSTWKALNVSEARKFHGNIMKNYRALVGCDKPIGPHRTDAEIIQQLGVYSPLNMVALLRIMLLRRVVRQANPGRFPQKTQHVDTHCSRTGEYFCEPVRQDGRATWSLHLTVASFH